MKPTPLNAPHFQCCNFYLRLYKLPSGQLSYQDEPENPHITIQQLLKQPPQSFEDVSQRHQKEMATHLDRNTLSQLRYPSPLHHSPNQLPRRS